ncbi:MAG: dihydroorotase [Rhodobacteraceae bacterium]|nr:dihydroorotase [Paracoccaceae bacterium]
MPGDRFDTGFDTVIAGGAVVSHRGVEVMDLGLRDGRIAALAGPGALVAAALEGGVIEARGLHVLPGVIDSYVHFREPGGEATEDFGSGSLGALLGGVTAVFDMPNTAPAVLDRESLAAKLALVGRHAWTDYALYVGADGGNSHLLADLETVPGVCGTKVFMGSSTSSLVISDPGDLEGIFAAGARVVSLHAEDEARILARQHIAEAAGDVRVHGEWRDVESAVAATRLAIDTARRLGRRIHILHVSTAEEIALIAANRDIVTCEVLPQHLILAAPDCYETHGTLVQQNPPIREARHRAALWAAVADGIVDVIGSDHGPHRLADKARPYPNRHSGMPGTQTLLPILLDFVAQGRLSLLQVADLVCAGPARVFGIAGKGRIAVGHDADFTLVDLGARRVIDNADIASKVGWTVWHGREVAGWPMATVIRGRLAMRDGEALGGPQGRPVRFHGALAPEATSGAAA